MLDLIEKTKLGLDITFEELGKLTELIFQLYEMVLIGNSTQIDMYNGNSESYDYVIEFVDCTYWEITSKNHLFLERLQIQFK